MIKLSEFSFFFAFKKDFKIFENKSSKVLLKKKFELAQFLQSHIKSPIIAPEKEIGAAVLQIVLCTLFSQTSVFEKIRLNSLESYNFYTKI